MTTACTDLQSVDKGSSFPLFPCKFHPYEIKLKKKDIGLKGLCLQLPHRSRLDDEVE